MEYNEALYDKIYKHLHDQLNKADKQDFEQLIARNPELIGEIKRHKNAEEMVMDAYLLGIKDQTRIVLKQKRQQANLKKWLGGGGMALVLFAGIATYINYNQQQSSFKTQLTPTNTVKDSSMQLSIHPTSTFKSPKPIQKSITAANKPENVQATEADYKITADLDKEAQLLYLQRLEQQRQYETSKAQKTDLEPNTSIKVERESASIEKKAMVEVEQSMPTLPIPAQELLFDLVYDTKQGGLLEFPTGGLDEGKFKIIDESGIVVSESDFNSQNKAIWNGQFKNSSVSHNKQLNVLIINNKNQVLGLGKISVVY